MGGNLCKWTISYFAAALAWLIAAEVLMVAGFGFPSADIAAPDTLVLVHMICLGWLSMAMCGALFQFVPVLVSRPLHAEGWILPAFVLLSAGLIALLAGFLALGGRMPPWLWLLPFGATLLIAGFALVAANLGLTLWQSRPLPASARFVALGLLAVCATMAFGGIFALALFEPAPGSLVSSVLASAVPIHAIAGLAGWLTVTAIGVSYRLLSMFMLAPDVDAGKSRLVWLFSAFMLGAAVIGGAVAVLVGQGLDLALMLSAACGLATLACYARDVAELYRKRKRRKLELNTRMVVWSFASLGAAVALGAVLAITGSLAAHVGALVFLIVFGWLSGLILANLYKIVPFLTWLETYGPVMGKAPTPRVHDLVAERRATKWFVMFFAASWAATALLMLGQPLGFRIAIAVIVVATFGILQELIRARRLTDVAAPLRLPAGALAPRLLITRT
ncbi:hypothetical protein [Bradyrhizobium sp.]|uniref:hypothetical protein n=1 Tax=Bradyrhizobium sp. TaxID=376 RepID=UPI00239CBE28|nr:hypothetical protein [Bradyrhizobium sp.]MDE2377206.1 hypothetical protein [Bradyrhizobium sp.]